MLEVSRYGLFHHHYYHYHHHHSYTYLIIIYEFMNNIKVMGRKRYNIKKKMRG